MRRSLWFLCAFPLIGCGSPATGPSPEVEPASLISALVPAVRMEPASLEDADNGWARLDQAMNEYGRFNVGTDALARGTLFDTKPGIAKVKALVDKVGPQLDDAVEASKMTNWQLPYDKPTAEQSYRKLRVKDAVKALVARGQIRILSGQSSEGIQDIMAARDIGLGIERGKGDLMDGMLGIACVALANRAFERACSDPRIGTAVIQEMLDGSPEPSAEDPGMQNSMRGELAHVVVPYVATLNDPLYDPETLANVGVPLPEQLVEFCKTLPNHFDRRDTVEVAGKAGAIAIESLGKNWQHQGDLQEYLHDLPKGWPADIMAGSTKKLSDKDLSAAKTALSKAQNPIGRLIVGVLLATFGQISDASFKWRTQTNAIRTMLAIRIYRDRHNGQLPPNLDALVQTGILKSAARDFYGDGTFRYDAARKIIWSVGENGKDDGGVDPPDDFANTRDLVWPAFGR